MCIWQVTGQLKCRLDAVAEIDADDICCSPFGGQLGVAAFAAATFEYYLVFEKIRLDGLQPAEKLLIVFIVFLSKVCPLPPEILGGFSFFLFDFLKIGKSRNTAYDSIFTITFGTVKNPFNYPLSLLFTSESQKNVPATRG